MNNSQQQGVYSISHTYNVPIEKVWKALTDKDEMKQWYFDLAEFKPEPGFAFQFMAGDDDKKYLHLCKVTEVIPGKKIAYTWQYEEIKGNTEVCFELFAEGDKTKLTLTHAGLDSFKTDDPNFAKESFQGGWTYFVTKALREYLEKP